MSGSAVARVVVLEHDYCIATWGPVYIVIFRHETTMEGVRAVEQRLQEFHRLTSHGAFITIVEANAPLPEAHVRDALASLLKKMASFIRSSAVVHEGSGFRAAAVRGVVTGLTLLARQPYPHRIFARFDDAARWLAVSLRETAPDKPIEAEELIEALRELRERIEAG
jgi:hypothetical protein